MLCIYKIKLQSTTAVNSQKLRAGWIRGALRSLVRPNSLVIQKCKWKSDGTRRRIKTEAGTVSFDQLDYIGAQRAGENGVDLER